MAISYIAFCITYSILYNSLQNAKILLKSEINHGWHKYCHLFLILGILSDITETFPDLGILSDITETFPDLGILSDITKTFPDLGFLSDITETFHDFRFLSVISEKNPAIVAENKHIF